MLADRMRMRSGVNELVLYDNGAFYADYSHSYGSTTGFELMSDHFQLLPSVNASYELDDCTLYFTGINWHKYSQIVIDASADILPPVGEDTGTALYFGSLSDPVDQYEIEDLYSWNKGEMVETTNVRKVFIQEIPNYLKERPLLAISGASGSRRESGTSLPSNALNLRFQIYSIKLK